MYFMHDTRRKFRSSILYCIRNKILVDPKLSGLGQAYKALGEKGVEVIKLGLSRKIQTNSDDARKVIREWERRDQTCCFQGSIQDLLGLSDTLFIAISYRHEPKSEWGRKEDGSTSKMSNRDQEDFVRVVNGVSGLCDYVIAWCDQVISTRLQNRENSQGWYNAGNLPYACLPVLKLSKHVSEDILGKRLWLKVERSLGKLGYGTIEPQDALSGLYASLGAWVPLIDLVQSFCQMMLSGYWPEPDDLDYWAKDYQQMKRWAMCVVSDTGVLVNPPIFEEIRGIDNFELLKAMHSLMIVPKGLGQEERPAYTTDSLFYLKVTAWNLFVRSEWEESNKFVNHYMGNMGPFCKFSWWKREGNGTLFGYLSRGDMATTVLAVEKTSGYLVYRRSANPKLYSHGDQYATMTTLRVLQEMALTCRVDVDLGGRWGLLYSSTEDDENVMPVPAIKNAMGGSRGCVDVAVPMPYAGLTTKLYRSAVSKRGEENSSEEVAHHLLQIIAYWNSHVQKSYDKWISVSDTLCGPTWLEGYTEDHVSFGLYDYLTRFLIAGDRRISYEKVALPSKWDFVQEVRRVATDGAPDARILADEMYGIVTKENSELVVDVKDIAMYMMSGGFTSCFDAEQLCKFLSKVAQNRQYWSTYTCALGGKLQMLFTNEEGNPRIAQRDTTLPDYFCYGVVRPGDHEAVESVSVPIEEGPEKYRMMIFRKPMESGASLPSLRENFPNSVYKFEDETSVFLLDFTILKDNEPAEKSILSIEGDKAEEENLELLAYAHLNEFHKLAKKLPPYRLQPRDLDEIPIGEYVIPDLERVINEAHKIETKFASKRDVHSNLIPREIARRFGAPTNTFHETRLKFFSTSILNRGNAHTAPPVPGLADLLALSEEGKEEETLRTEVTHQFETSKRILRKNR